MPSTREGIQASNHKLGINPAPILINFLEKNYFLLSYFYNLLQIVSLLNYFLFKINQIVALYALVLVPLTVLNRRLPLHLPTLFYPHYPF